jgi:hypothetical protein
MNMTVAKIRNAPKTTAEITFSQPIKNIKIGMTAYSAAAAFSFL